MSTASTISNLREALNCAGKCDCCNQLQQQINSLKSEVNNLKSQIIGRDEINRLIASAINAEKPQIIQSAISGAEPLIAAAAAGAVTTAVARVDPRVREALDRAFRAENASNAWGQRVSDAVAEARAARSAAEQSAGASARSASSSSSSASASRESAQQANFAGTTARRAATDAEIAQQAANEAKKEAAQASFASLRSADNAATAKDAARIAANNSELSKNLTIDAKNAATAASGSAARSADEARGLKRIAEEGLQEVRGLAGRAIRVADDALSTAGRAIVKAGDALGNALEAIGFSRRLQREVIEQGIKLGTLALRVADIAGLIIEVLASVGLTEALGARVDAVERGQQQLSDSISQILGRILPPIKAQAQRAEGTANVAIDLARILSPRVDSAMGQAGIALAEARQATSSAANALILAAAANVALGVATNLATRAIGKAGEAVSSAAQAKSTASNAVNTASRAANTADTALTTARQTESGLSRLRDRVGGLERLIDQLKNRASQPGRPGRPGRDGIDGKNGITTTVVVQVPGQPGRPGRDGITRIIQIPGRPGRDGIDGKDGKDVNPADLAGLRSDLAAIKAQNQVIINGQQQQTNITLSGLGNLGLLQVINNKLGAQIPGGLSEKLNKFARWSGTDRLLNIIATVAAVHNAFHLSTDIIDSLFGAIDTALNLPNIFKDDEGQAIDSRSIVGNTLDTFFKGIFGVSNWTQIKNTFAKTNRIYQSTINMFSRVRSLFDSTRELSETIAENTGKIGNALQEQGVVYANAYAPMAERYDGFRDKKLKRTIQGLERIDNTVSSIAAITGDVSEVAEEINEFKQAKTEFDKTIAELAPNPRPIINQPVKRRNDLEDRQTNPPSTLEEE